MASSVTHSNTHPLVGNIVLVGDFLIRLGVLFVSARDDTYSCLKFSFFSNGFHER